MSLTDDQAMLLLERLADRVHERPAPVESLLLTSRRRVRRRHRNTFLACAVAATVVVGGIGVIRWNDGPESPPAPLADADRDADPGEKPVPAPGTRYVGRGNVVVAVPQSWETFTQSVCARPRVDFVAFEQVYTGYRCPFIEGARELQLTGVTIGSTGYAPGKESLGVSCRTSRPPQCGASIHVPDGGVSFRLEGYANESPDLLEAVFESVTILPPGWTTVPYVETENRGLPTKRDVRAALEAAGFQVDVEPASAVGTYVGAVVGTVPAAGEVVAEGGTVTLRVAVSAY
jgi:hypothetical protein